MSYLKYNWFFEWAPYVAIAIGFISLVFLASWCDGMQEQDCRDRGGDHLVRTGRYIKICVDSDGRILE